MPKKSDLVDLSLTGAVNALNEFFFELPSVKDMTDDNADRRESVGKSEPDPKPAKVKPVGNTFNTKAEGKTPGKSKSTEGNEPSGRESEGDDE